MIDMTTMWKQEGDNYEGKNRTAEGTMISSAHIAPGNVSIKFYCYGYKYNTSSPWSAFNGFCSVEWVLLLLLLNIREKGILNHETIKSSNSLHMVEFPILQLSACCITICCMICSISRNAFLICSVIINSP